MSEKKRMTMHITADMTFDELFRIVNSIASLGVASDVRVGVNVEEQQTEPRGYFHAHKIGESCNDRCHPIDDRFGHCAGEEIQNAAKQVADILRTIADDRSNEFWDNPIREAVEIALEDLGLDGKLGCRLCQH